MPYSVCIIQRELNLMKQIYLHIGHGKTGTSAIQACFAQAHQTLKDAGILYKYHSSFSAAVNLKISSGNIDPASDQGHWFEYQVLKTLSENPSYHTYIFSSENAFHHMDSVLDCLDRLRGLANLHVILAVRNPADMLGSEYQQYVKRDGLAITFESFLQKRQYTCVHTCKALSVIKALEAKGVSLSLFNFSQLGLSITRTIVDVIGIGHLVDADKLSAARVNRSMTMSELQILILTNYLYGKHAGALLSDTLVNSLPDIQSEPMQFSSTSLRLISTRMMPFVDDINRRLDPLMPLVLSSCLRIEPAAELHFSEAQAAIIKDVMKTLSAIDDKEWRGKGSAILSRIAHKIDAKKPLGSRAAFRLLRLAHRMNPSDQEIRHAIANIRLRLKN